MSMNQSQSSDSPMIPATILTGFLGAGKTTLLQRILNEFHGQRIAVIENEFAQENIDNELLVQENNEQVIELSNGCICCSVRGDLIDTLNNLARRRAAGEIHFERVIIETTGMAKPGPVCQSFFMDDEVAQTYRLDAVITVVDAKHGMATLDSQPEAQNQIGFADRLLISKKDLVNDTEYEALRARLMHINPRASIKVAHFGATDLNELLDVNGFDIDAILDLDPQFLAEQANASTPQPAHHHHHHHHHDDVGAFVFNSKRPFDPERLEDFLSGIVQVYGPDLLRYKGILYIKGINRRMLFQGVHMLFGAEPGKAWVNSEKPNTKMVFIGRKLPQQVFTQGLESCLV